MTQLTAKETRKVLWRSSARAQQAPAPPSKAPRCKTRSGTRLPRPDDAASLSLAKSNALKLFTAKSDQANASEAAIRIDRSARKRAEKQRSMAQCGGFPDEKSLGHNPQNKWGYYMHYIAGSVCNA